MTDRKPRALSMFSGGLDSILATKLMMELGVDVLALHFTAPFINPLRTDDRPTKSETWAARLGVSMRIIDVWPEYFELLKKPRYGFGKNLNPCIDCKILFLRKAREIMEKEGYDFVFTGEVKGQRPMSQNKQSLDNIAAVSGLNDRLLRPLSAQVLPPSFPERTGLIDREQLLAFTGRGRKNQVALAAKLGIDDPPGTGGGCLLTDRRYSLRLMHLMEIKEEISHEDLHLLHVGRHLQLSRNGKVIVSRDEQENGLLERWADFGDVLLWPEDWLGPVALVVSPQGVDDADLALVAAMMNRWGKPTGDGLVTARRRGDSEAFSLRPGHLVPDLAMDELHIHKTKSLKNH
ncbi:MAG: hypothetical protein P9L99_20365 [Candidatus Lernaella stagnicola]|nr:hypothetical protein [Candidatus Lernaella stagnicola]